MAATVVAAKELKGLNDAHPDHSLSNAATMMVGGVVGYEAASKVHHNQNKSAGITEAALSAAATGRVAQQFFDAGAEHPLRDAAMAAVVTSGAAAAVGHQIQGHGASKADDHVDAHSKHRPQSRSHSHARRLSGELVEDFERIRHIHRTEDEDVAELGEHAAYRIGHALGSVKHQHGNHGHRHGD